MIEEMEGAAGLAIFRLARLLTPVKPEPPPPPAAPLWCTRRRGFVSGFPRSGGAPCTLFTVLPIGGLLGNQSKKRKGPEPLKTPVPACLDY
jgi:hypothetical protein